MIHNHDALKQPIMGSRVRALWSRAPPPGEDGLVFSEGDIIEVLKGCEEDPWRFQGRLNDISGDVPFNFVVRSAHSRIRLISKRENLRNRLKIQCLELWVRATKLASKPCEHRPSSESGLFMTIQERLMEISSFNVVISYR